MLKKLSAILLALMLLFSVAACAAPSATPAPAANAPASQAPASEAPAAAPADGNVFRISTYLQLSGNNAEAGNNAKNGIDLAVKYINENGGFNGSTVVIDHYDSTGSTEEAVKIVQKVIENKSADAVVGSVNSNEVSACIPYLNQAEIYNFGLGTSATWMMDESMIWTFRASANNNRIAPLDVDMIMEKGLPVTTRQECDTAETDFSGQITQILATEPDIIFMSLIGDTFGPFVKQLRNMGYKGMLACKECFSPAYQQVAGIENSNYIIYVYPYVPYKTVEECTIPYMKSMLEKYHAAYGKTPTHESAYRGWDTMMAMWEASKIAGSNDSTALRDATHKVKIEGLGGTLDYTKGDREGYSAFNSFVLLNEQNIVLEEWLATGGYEAYKAATGRDR